MTQPTRILVCSPYSQPGWRWLAATPQLRNQPIEWEFVHRIEATFLERKVHTPDIALIRAARRAIRIIRQRGIDLLEDAGGRREGLGERLTHAHRLAALARKYECDRHTPL